MPSLYKLVMGLVLDVGSVSINIETLALDCQCYFFKQMSMQETNLILSQMIVFSDGFSICDV